jgi:acetyl esterase/lipase
MEQREDSDDDRALCNLFNARETPRAQAQEFYMALKERKVPVEFVVYPRENHGFTEACHQMDRVQRYVRFFGKNLGMKVVTERSERSGLIVGPWRQAVRTLYLQLVCNAEVA